MNYKQLYIFVEGIDDERFVNHVFKPILSRRYDNVKIIKYAALPHQAIINFIKTFNSQSSSDYVFMCDMDAKGSFICVTSRKEKEQNKFAFCLDGSKIIVVKEEIESWYIAGVLKENLNRLRIKVVLNTESMNKEYFEKNKPKEFFSTNDFMIEILKDYSLIYAVNHNKSLKYFVDKYQLLH